MRPEETATFLDRLQKRADDVGRGHDLHMQWALAVRDMEFPLTAKGYELLADPWNRWSEVVYTPALRRVMEWLLTKPSEQTSGLFFYGPSGTGKSFAVAFLCVVRHVTRPEGGNEPVWCQGADLSTRVLMTRDLDLTARTLVIDDLGAGNVTAGGISALENTLDHRGKPGRLTVITSNAQPDTVRKVYRSRVESRFRGIFGAASASILCDGGDLR